MDDARTPKPSRHPLAIAGGLLLAVTLGALAALAAAWYLTPRSLDRFAATHGELRATGWSAEEAGARLDVRFAREHDLADRLAASRRALRDRLAAAVPPGTPPNPTRAADCAATLRASAAALRALAGTAPDVAALGRAALNANVAPFVSPAGEAISAALAASDAAALEAALARERNRFAAWLELSAASLAPVDRGALWPAWRTALLALAADHAARAEALEAGFPVWLSDNQAPHVAMRTLAIEPRLADPSAALARHPLGVPGVVVEPITAFWAAAAGAGAAFGLLAFALFLVFHRPRVSRDERAPVEPLAAPRAWLHVVAGGHRSRIARGVCEVVAHALARRERVVVVDAARALKLHSSLELSARLGFVECMTQGQPSLGLVQGGGFTGLFLLARGRRGKITDWLPLDRVLEELRPHFDRVILAFEADIPPVVGGVLAGRVMQGWWAGPGDANGGAASRVSGRLAIALAGMDLAGMPKASLEAMERRIGALQAAAPPPPAPVAAEVPAPIEFRVSPPAVMDCDLQIRQKLRFLAWMRRMRTEHERSETAGRS